MCQFKSAIVLKDEQSKGGFRLLLSPWTESHSELCTIFKLNDTANAKLYFARVEFTPESMDKAYIVESYKLSIDEGRTPEWFDAEMKEAVTAKLAAYIKSIIVDGDVNLLIGGQFIVAPGAKVECAHSMVINAICGGTVSAIWGGTVSEIWGGTVSAIWGGTVSAIWEHFSGLIGKIGPHARILSDNRPKEGEDRSPIIRTGPAEAPPAESAPSA